MEKQFLNYSRTKELADQDIQKMEQGKKLMPPDEREAVERVWREEAARLIEKASNQPGAGEGVPDARKKEAFLGLCQEAAAFANTVGLDISYDPDADRLGEITLFGASLWYIHPEIEGQIGVFMKLVGNASSMRCAEEGGETAFVLGYDLTGRAAGGSFQA